MSCCVDASLERVVGLIAKAQLLGADQQRLAQAQQSCISRNSAATSALQVAVQAIPFSADIFRLRLLDAKRLGLNTEAQSAQGLYLVQSSSSSMLTPALQYTRLYLGSCTDSQTFTVLSICSTKHDWRGNKEQPCPDPHALLCPPVLGV